jgi:hypothetical protein
MRITEGGPTIGQLRDTIWPDWEGAINQSIRNLDGDPEKLREKKRNPEGGAESMYSSFHGTPSTAIDEYEEKEHYHSNLAALGELVGLKVRTVSGYDVTLGFESRKVNNPHKQSNPDFHTQNYRDGELAYSMGYTAGEAASEHDSTKERKERAEFETWLKTKDERDHYFLEWDWRDGYEDGYADIQENPRRSNIWPFNSLTRTTIMHVPSGHKFHTATEYKHHTIYKSESKDGYVVPGIERDSVFDSVKDAKKFIDHWTKQRPNPKDTHTLWLLYRHKRGNYWKPFAHGTEEMLKSARIALDEDVLEKVVLPIGKKPNPGNGHASGPFASSQRFVGDTVGAIYRPIDAFTGMVAGAADKGLRAVGVKGNPWFKRALDRGVYKVVDEDGVQVHTGSGLSKKEALQIAKESRKEGEKVRLMRMNPRKSSNPDHVLLCSTEDGKNLSLIGGDQSLDLDALKIDGDLAEKELITIGEVWGVNYRTEKVFGDGGSEDGLTEYIHIHGPKETKPPRGGDLWQDAVPPKDTTFGTGELPTLIYDKRNQKLLLSGGIYFVNQPLIGTSPGLEH